MSSEVARGKHRDREKRQQDHEFLIHTMYKFPSLSLREYHELLLAEIQRRGDSYTITLVQTGRDISNIKRNSVAATGVNIKNIFLDTLEDYNYLLDIAFEELHVRITTDRTDKKIILEDIQAKDIEKLNADERAVFYKIRNQVKHSRTEFTEIRAGSDIKDMIEVISRLHKERRALTGIDAPKKVEMKSTNIHKWEDMTEQDIIDKYKLLGINTKEKLQDFIEDIEFTVQPKKYENGKHESQNGKQ